MTFVCFGNNGYDYCDDGRYVLFSADNTHNILFDYVSKDLGQLPVLLERYVSKRIDVMSFELKDYQHSDNDCKKIIGILKSVHPYYKHEYRMVFIEAVAEYFNALLANSKYRQRYIEERSDIEWKKWYFDRFKKLASPYLKITDNIDRFYAAYLRKIGYDVPENIEPEFYSGAPEARGFSSELKTQEAIKWMLFFILDISVPSIGELTTAQRAWLYGMKFKSVFSMPDVNTKIKRSFDPASLFRNNQDRSRESDQLSELNDLFPTVNAAFRNVQIDRMKLTPEMSEALSSIANYAATASPLGVYEECGIDNLYQLLYLEIMLMVQTGTDIRQCKHCGMYFIVTDRKEVYCDRKFGAKGERCSEVGSKRSWQTKVKEELPLQLYTRARKTHHARWKRHGIMTEAQYKSWLEDAGKKLDEVREKVKNGETDISEFEKWLKK